MDLQIFGPVLTAMTIWHTFAPCLDIDLCVYVCVCVRVCVCVSVTRVMLWRTADEAGALAVALLGTGAAVSLDTRLLSLQSGSGSLSASHGLFDRCGGAGGRL